MPRSTLQILLGAAESVVDELGDIPRACCNGGVPMIEWLDVLRAHLKMACQSASEADRAAVPDRSILASPSRSWKGSETVKLHRREVVRGTD